MNWSVHCADVLTWCEEYEGEKFHAVLCDPPYELAFMGKSWDNSGVAFQPATWAAIAEHLHPGGFIMAFGGSRTYHRLAVAAEDAGLIVHPALVWLNGQGFPKATRIGKNGSHPEFEGHRYGLQALKPCAEFILVAQKPYEGKPVDCITSTGAGSLWIDGSRVGAEQHTYRARGSKCLVDQNFQHGIRPYVDGLPTRDEPEVTVSGRWPPNVCLTHVPPRPDGTGGWLPGCERLGVKRVRPGNGSGICSGKTSGDKSMFGAKSYPLTYTDPDGTEPVQAYACVLACDGCGYQWTAEMRGACPECGGEARWACPVGALSEQSGERRSAATASKTEKKYGKDQSLYGLGQSSTWYNDKGTAARFYPQFSWQHEIAERLAGVVPFRYQAKAGRRERSQGLDDFYWRKDKSAPIGFVRISQEEWESLPDKQRAQGNIHPTQKPIELCKWLATLILPPPEYAPRRRILIPFFGKGSEGAGAGLAGWEEIVGIEKESGYCDAGQARLDHWLGQMQLELSL